MRIARELLPALALVLLPTVQGDRPADRDPPSRVSRLSYLAGSVSFRPASVDDWTDATINYPVTTGDHLWTDADARAELTLGSTAIRLAPQSAFSFLALDDRTTQIRLTQGAVDVRLRNLGDDQTFEIDTPNGAVSLLRAGSYRVNVDSTGDTAAITVRRGEAEVTAAGSAFSVRADQTAIVAGTDRPTYDLHDAVRPDAWEDWCVSRDRRWDESRSARYVSREISGYEDLDENGEWRETPAYGAVWVPRTTIVGWAPYRYGHWAWVDPWGWTWIDDAPWGFAPFHYGRWVYWDGAWAWVPGRVVARPVYAPALVVFVGGSSWHGVATIGSTGAGVAWFPLAPEEPYVPAYHVSRTYVRNVNVTNVTNITNINVTNVNVTNITYVNRTTPGGVTVVSQETFARARPVAQNVVVVPRERLDRATVITAAPVVPVKQSVLVRTTDVTVRRPPERLVERTVVVRTTPPPPPVPFVAREQALRAQPGRPLDDATLKVLRARAPVARTDPVKPATPPPATGGGNPMPVMKPAREGLPTLHPLPPSVIQPTREQPKPPVEQPKPPVERPAQPVVQDHKPPVERGRPPAERPAQPEERKPPAERPQPPVERPQPPVERGRPPAERPAVPAERPTPTVERPAPAEKPAAPEAKEKQKKEKDKEKKPEKKPEKPKPDEKPSEKPSDH